MGSLRQRWKSSALGHRQPTTHLVEEKQQLCIEAAPAKNCSGATKLSSLVFGKMIDFPGERFKSRVYFLEADTIPGSSPRYGSHSRRVLNEKTGA